MSTFVVNIVFSGVFSFVLTVNFNSKSMIRLSTVRNYSFFKPFDFKVLIQKIFTNNMVAIFYFCVAEKAIGLEREKGMQTLNGL